MMFERWKRKKESTGCLGFYDTKPYDSFSYALVYAGQTLIKDEDKVHVYARNYKKTVFLVVLIDEETGVDVDRYRYETLKDALKEKGIEEGDSVIHLWVFQHDNEQTRAIAKVARTNTKTQFNQVLIFNYREVRLEYWRPVPKFYKLYDHYAEAIYYDLTAIDPLR